MNMHKSCRLLCSWAEGAFGRLPVPQVLLAIANGAWLLRPEWVSASLEAGQWLPEPPFEAKVRAPAPPGRRAAGWQSPALAEPPPQSYLTHYIFLRIYMLLCCCHCMKPSTN